MVAQEPPGDVPQFLLLGPLEVRAAGRPVPVSGSRQRVVLAMLLLEAGRVVPTERLATAVWDDEPPLTARTQIQNSVSKLRAVLMRAGLPDAIGTHESGYLIRVPEEAVDAARFSQLVAAGRDAPQREAAVLFRAALGMWRGNAVAGVRSRLVQAAALRLDEERLAVTEERVELELALGRHHEVVSELRGLVAANPLREKLYAQLMLALYRDGRQAEALEVYRRSRQVLVEEHGLEPGEELRALERAILDEDPALSRPATEPERVVPRQLPVRAGGFVGRSRIRQELRRVLAARDASEVVVMSGPAGVGKTALAVEIAYEVGEQFPDGQLFAHLSGSDTRPVPPEQVLGDFLRVLGVPPAVLPGGRDALAGLYRSQLAGRRLLVLLDDAASARQVEPLLPSDPRVAVIVTSRRALPGLPNERRFDLGVLSPTSSLLLLSRAVGAARVAAEREAAATVAESCGHLPLALRIAAAKLAARRHWRIARMAGRLRNESQRLDELSLNGGGVRASLSVSVEALSPPARKLLLLLGGLGSTDFAGWVAGPLLGVDADPGADVLDELVDAQLAEVQVGTGQRARYRLHDLVGVFARELLAADLPADARAAAQHRLLRCWLFLTCQAHRREYGGDFTVLHSAAAHWPLPGAVVDELLADPIRWLETEHANLVSAIHLAAERDEAELCWDLAVTAVTLFETRAYREDWRETHELALEAVVRHRDRRAEAAVRCSRAGLALVEQRFTDAESDLAAALAWFEQTDEPHGRGLALRGLASIDRLQGRPGQARDRYRQALVDLRASGDRVGEAHVLINLAQLGADHGRGREAEELLQRAQAISADVGARRVVAQARHRLGQLYLDRGELGRAETEFHAVLGAVTTAEDPVGKAYALLGIGAVRLGRDDRDRARSTLTEALETMRLTGSRLGEGRVLLTMAELCRRAGEMSAAARWSREADDAFAEIGAAAWRERVRQLRQQLAGESPLAG